MKTNVEMVVCGLFLTASLGAVAQTVRPHKIDAISLTGDKTVSLSLSGNVSATFKPFFDIYNLEVSTDLNNWAPLSTLVRTNASTNALVFLDSDAATQRVRFYRTFTNHLITPFPKPTGPYQVSTSSRAVINPSNSNRYNIRTNSAFMVSSWYPANAGAGVLPTEYLETKLADFLSIPHFVSHSYSNAPFANGKTNCPIVLYSHGVGGHRRENADKAEELASYGYVVISMDHVDCAATVLPGNKLVAGQDLDPVSAMPGRLRDVQVVMDELTQLNGTDALFAGRLNLTSVGILGWSRGGGIAGEVCRKDDRFRAAVLLEPALYWAADLKENGLQKPFICMVSEVNLGYPGWREDSEALFNAASQDAFWFQIRGTEHYTFSQDAWIVNPTTAHRIAASTMTACTLSFFNKYLKNQDDHLFDTLTAVYTNVYNFMKK